MSTGARNGERGEGRLGTLFGLCLLLTTIYLGYKVLPVLINAYAFRDYIEQESRFAALAKKDEDVAKRVLRKAQELELPVNAKNIRVERTPTHFDIAVNYSVPIETPVYTYVWIFNEEYKAPLF
jgi:hypothetical protein